ncbi:hypothetical protein D3C81_1370800 [compost metagenome]
MKRNAWLTTPDQSARYTWPVRKPCQTRVRRWIASQKRRAPQASPTALMAPAEVPTITGNGFFAPSGSSSAMAASTPT